MKKTTLAIASACTLLLAGCSDSENAAESASTVSETTAESSSAETSTSTEAGPQPTQGDAAPAPSGDAGPGDGGSGGSAGSDGHPFGTPVESGPCGLDEILKPGVTAEGKNVVCIRDTVNDDRGVWVGGPAPTGEVVKEGDPCEDGYPDNPQNGDKGAVDADGKIMLCAGDKWVYGP